MARPYQQNSSIISKNLGLEVITLSESGFLMAERKCGQAARQRQYREACMQAPPKQVFLQIPTHLRKMLANNSSCLLQLPLVNYIRSFIR